MATSLKRNRGGIRQRLDDYTDSTKPALESGLANFLLEQFAWGSMSPQLVQQIAMLAVKDINNVISTGGYLKDLEQISRIGGQGKLSNNMHRDLQQFQQKSLIPLPFEVSMPFADVGPQKQYMMLPHELFSSLYHNYRDQWNEIMLPSSDKLLEFWEAQSTHPNMDGNPIKSRPDYKTRCLPIGLHGDEVPITGKGKVWSKSMLTFEWTSLLGKGWSASRMMWIWSSFDKMLDTSEHGTLAHFWKVFSWSCYWLQQGRWPTHDWQGNQYPPESEACRKANTPLADGYYATIYAVMGDLDYFAKTLELPRSTSSNPCALCKCTLRGSTSWKNNDQNAEWLGLCWKPLEWVVWDGRSKIELFSIPGVSGATVAVDYMHSKYLGSDQYQFGSVLYVICYHILANPPKQNLAECWAAILSFYKANNTKHRYQNITKLSMFVRKSGVIKLRGKAAEIKGFSAAIGHIWQQYMNPTLEIHQKIKLMLKLNLKMEEMMDLYTDQIKFPAAAAQKFVEYGFAMFQLQKEINHHFNEDPDVTKQLFNSTAKCHMVLHSCLLSDRINPKLVWCFMGEDFMRKIQKLGESCVRGNKAAAVSQKMMMHYRLAMHFHLKFHN